MTCAGCGSDIQRVTLPDGREVTVDSRAELGKGPDRYMIDSEDSTKAEPVHPEWEGAAYGDHSKTCAAKELGQTL